MKGLTFRTHFGPLLILLLCFHGPRLSLPRNATYIVSVVHSTTLGCTFSIDYDLDGSSLALQYIAGTTILCRNKDKQDENK